MFAVPRHIFRRAALAAAAALLLASCGGGGNGDSAAPAPQPSSSNSAGVCTLDAQKQFVHSYMDETYLWYDEIPNINPAGYSTVPAYFNALLVRTPDATGQPKDRFSAVLTSAGANALFSTSPASIAQAIPSNLLGAASSSVPISKVVSSPGGRQVGYILLNDHNEGAQDALVAAFENLRSASVSELVLDLRYNPGGFLYVALAAASMVTGPQSEGKIFEQLRYSAKRQPVVGDSTYRFSSKLQVGESVYPLGHPLPQLNLPRLYVLASGQTCSASESIVNSLRGIDIQVVLVGSTTCGKPYGFHRQDNCGLAFFPVEFQGYNAKNFGDYTAGFPANCPVADNFTSPLGSTDEPLLATALRHIDTGTCPGATQSRGVLAQNPLATRRAQAPAGATPAWDGRLLKPGPR
jgi:hypothetical protein